ARSVAAFLAYPDLDRLATALAPDVVYIDHRTVGVGSLHGSDALLRSARALLDLSQDFAARLDDVLALRPDALVGQWTHFGIGRASGGAFERPVCQLWVSGVDGLLIRGEQFDADRAVEALARFDALTAEPTAAQRRRRVRANAATALAARQVVASAARNADA